MRLFIVLHPVYTGRNATMDILGVDCVIVRCTSSQVKEKSVEQRMDTVNADGGKQGAGLGVHFTQKIIFFSMHVPKHTIYSSHSLSEQWFSTRGQLGGLIKLPKGPKDDYN